MYQEQRETIGTVEAPQTADAEQIGVSPRMLDLLLRVREHLASGAADGLFSMVDWETRSECGTAMCIGGWMACFDGSKPQVAYAYKVDNPRLTPLFFPPREISRSITIAQAIEAIDNFTTRSPGDPRWHEVMAG